MKNEIVPLLKSLGVVIVGFLLGNYIQTNVLSKPAKPTPPTAV
jgi:hypothetical protein